jgi:protein-disulfide isomerase
LTDFDASQRAHRSVEDKMKPKLDSLITALFLVCALVATGAIIHREFFASPAGRAQAEQKPSFLKDWRADLAKGIRMGPAAAPVQLLEFSDFECPFCANLHKDLKALQVRYPAKVALTYVHFPLPMHRFAEPAARVAECAGEQGHFEAMYDRLFDQQESFGLKPWSEFAAEAGVPDSAAFETCSKRTDPIPRVVDGQRLGKEFDVQGTPTLIVNGWKLGRPPNLAELDSMVKAILAGKNPVGAN